MNIRALAKQALRYLNSLNQPLPSDEDVNFYTQNREDYKALLKLNLEGLGATRSELKALVNAPLTDKEIKRIVRRLETTDNLISVQYAKQDNIEKKPRLWDGFYSGYEAKPTNRCKQLLNTIDKKITALSIEQHKLLSKITMAQAIKEGYCVDGMEDEDFKPV